MRTLVIAGIAFLLLGPFFKYVERQVQKPIVLIAQDNSSSITMAPDSGFYKNEYLTELNSLSLKLEEEYEIQRYTFDSDLDNSFEIDYSGKQSDISKAINDMMDRNVNRNVGAVILASDGIFNRGVSPSFLASDKGVPIYTVALGDTTIRRDLLIENIARNRLAYLGNDFPVEIQIRADRLKGKNAVLRIRKDGEVLFKRTIEIDDASFVRTIPALLNAKNIGRQRYDVSLSPLAGELTEANNFSSFYIDILDSRQKVLMVYKSPHPDIAAIRNSIESNENYEVVMRSTSDFSGDLSQFDLLITHGLPDASGSAGNLLERARDKNLPIWAIGGVAISWKDAQQAGFGIEARLKGGSNTTDASPSLVRNFSLFSLSEEVSTAITNWAPIKTSFAEFFSEPSARILFEQRIGVVDTDQPLWIFSEVEGYKSSLTIGEGIWRWRIQNFAERGDFSAFDELVSRTVQYLATKEDRRQFRVYGKDKFDE
ncbi:MAG: hypothetical protein HKO93_05960, partial [Flavobacteriales bacterium]|nr:hypothetical protein [Flavobacteriales bacterium]